MFKSISSLIKRRIYSFNPCRVNAEQSCRECGVNEACPLDAAGGSARKMLLLGIGEDDDLILTSQSTQLWDIRKSSLVGN